MSKWENTVNANLDRSIDLSQGRLGQVDISGQRDGFPSIMSLYPSGVADGGYL